MQKNITQYKSVIGDFESLFSFEQNCPLEVAKGAVFECLKWLGQIEDAIKAQQAQEEQKKAEDQANQPSSEDLQEQKAS